MKSSTVKPPDLFLRILIPFCIGIAVLSEIQFTKLNSVISYLSILLIFIIFIIRLLYSLFKVYNYKTHIAITINVLFFILGGWAVQKTNDTLNPAYFMNTSASFLKIMVAEEPVQRGNLLKFKAQVITKIISNKKVHSTGYLLVIMTSDSLHPRLVEYGETYFVPARYKPVEAPGNPAEFDSRSWLANQRIYAQSFLYAEELVPVEKNQGSALVNYALTLRKKQVEVYRKLIKNEEAFAVASTLLLGYRSDLDTETLSAYSRTGTIHALSVSGMHVGIIYVVLNFALQWMNRHHLLKVLKLLLILGLIWFYTLLTGYSPSVLRSAIMLSMFIIAKAFQKQSGGYHILSCSAFILLFYNPLLLWDVGFQLSYMAVWGLVYLQPLLYHLFSCRQKWLGKLWNMIALSIAAQVFTFPLSVYYFHQFPVYFIISNLFIALPVALLMYTGLAILIFKLYWLAPAFEWLIILMNKGLAEIAALPYSAITQIWLTKTELILLIMVFITAGIARKHSAFLYFSLGLLLILQSMLAIDKLYKMRYKGIWVFQLKRNYATAFITGRQVVLVTDLKTTDPVFRFHIQPALDRQRIKRIVCIAYGKDTLLNGLKQQKHQLHFRGFRALLMDDNLNYTRVTGRPHFDVVWLHKSPKINISELMEDVTCKSLWIDASNKPYAVRKYQQDTLIFKVPAIVFKKFKSYLIE